MAYNSPTYDYLFKVIVVGPTGVGKSSIILQFTDRKFDPKMDFTIGVEFGAKLMTTSGGKKVKFQLWDTAGQESFRSITNSYYRGAQASFLVYDVTRRASFDDVAGWLDEIRNCADPNIVVMLVGNKSDCVEQREVPREMAEHFAAQNGLFFLETSAKTAENVDKAFEMACDEIIHRVQSGQMSSTKQPQRGVTPDLQQSKSSTDTPKGGCCT